MNSLPQILLQVEVKSKKIQKSRLSLACSFQLQITGDNSVNAKIYDWLKAYAENTPLPTLPLEFPEEMTYFTTEVLNGLAFIPKGATFSYSEVAKRAGAPKACRAIGTALSKNPFTFFLPCHRVIRSNGALGGFTPDIEIKKHLLEYERAQ